MPVLGDRAVAALLSALAEAPDYRAATSFLLSEVVELTGAARACILRLDAAQNALVVDACNGFSDQPAVAIPAGDLSNPLVIAALALIPVHGTPKLATRA